MTKTGQSIQNYFRETRSLLYSYLISLPLLLLYEVLIFVSQPDTDHPVRLAVDVWIRTLFSNFSNNLLSITLIVVALIGMVILVKERKKLKTLKVQYFAGILAESCLYAFSLALLLSVIVGAIVQMVQPEAVQSLPKIELIALSLGAGLYEELFFRVILVSALLYVFKYFMTKKSAAYTSAIIVAALLFSLAHYIGGLGDAFTFGSFLFRFLFGLALNAIYLWRGFGTAAWTHAIYDIMVVVYG